MERRESGREPKESGNLFFLVRLSAIKSNWVKLSQIGGTEFKVESSQHEAPERWQRRPAAVLSRSGGGTPLPLCRQKGEGKKIGTGHFSTSIFWPCRHVVIDRCFSFFHALL
jgi:hypothetical protein